MYGASRHDPKHIVEGISAPWDRRSGFLFCASTRPSFRNVRLEIAPAFPVPAFASSFAGPQGCRARSHCPRAPGFGVGLMWRLRLTSFRAFFVVEVHDQARKVRSSEFFLGSVRYVFCHPKNQASRTFNLCLSGAKLRITPWVRILCDACSRCHVWRRLISRGVQRRTVGWC